MNVYERLYYCSLIKENHNAEKAFSVTTFGFEINIMDKCCVCGKQPQIRSGTANASCAKTKCVCAASSPHTHTVLTADGVWTLLNKSISTSEAAPLRAVWPMHGKKKPGHPFFAIWLFWRHFVKLLLMIILPYVCYRDILQLFAKTRIGQRNRDRFFCPYCTALI